MFYKSYFYLIFICIYLKVTVVQSATTNQEPNYNLRNPVNNFFDRIHHFKTTLISLLQQKIQRLQEQFAPIRPVAPPMTLPSSGIPTFPNIQRPPGHWITQTMVVPPPGRPGTSWITQTGVTYQAFPLGSPFPMSYPGFFHQTWHGVSYHPGLGVQTVVNPPPFYPGAFPTVVQPQVPQPTDGPEVVIPTPQTTPNPVVPPTVSSPISQPVIPAPVPQPPTVTPPGVLVQNSSLPGAQNTTTTTSSSQVVPNTTLPLVQNITQTVQNGTSTIPQNNTQNVTSSQAGQNVSSIVVPNGNTTVLLNQTAPSGSAAVPVSESLTSTQKGTQVEIAGPTTAGILPAGTSSNFEFEERTGPRAIC